ncbi:hypothetical protein SAMN05216327_105490 [Dyadobacter sp. SG02]|uniref:hypothetical protein n=1 Tax=Dyadobacter sp. SG02 TaxID=1855291 RepID=UPI0008D8BC99|nr:hypothetical protein [Dyadobacter sp. SG02]SEJ05285.1 hypothetical protein SAMN05216327_105490 [Dyadobacter sp. SG02]
MKSLIAILISAALAFTFTACHDSRELMPAPETIFDDHGLHVITSFHNDRTRTISVLYGNDDALAYASQVPGVATPNVATPGTVFKLVTWDLKQNPLWFGSNINGGVQSVETVTVSAGQSAPAIGYTIENSVQKKDEKAVSSNAERISFIFAQRASVFP